MVVVKFRIGCVILVLMVVEVFNCGGVSGVVVVVMLVLLWWSLSSRLL